MLDEPQEQADELKQSHVVHPPWCDLVSCNVKSSGKGTHNSRAFELRANAPSPLGIALTLIQAVPTPGYPHSGCLMVAVTFLDTDDSFDFGTIPMDVDTAQRLGTALVDAPRVISAANGPGLTA